jgi:hypothetical protein
MQVIGKQTAVGCLAKEAYLEFNDVADFIWKAPSLIEHQEEIERAKLREYFPNDIKKQSWRWWYESSKLKGIFPFLISVGNVFSVVSLFETDLLRLCLLVQGFSGVRLRDTKGQGVYRSLEYLRRMGVGTTHSQFSTPVDAALKIRNCLVHASGFLSYSREEEELKRIVKSRTFLVGKHRNAKDDDPVRIIQSDLGVRLHITNEYPWLLSMYLRDFFLELCRLAESRPQGTSPNGNPSLRHSKPQPEMK